MKVRRVAGLLLGLVVLAACSGPQVRSRADRERDAQVVADALRQVDLGGARFDMDNQLTYTGGSSGGGGGLR